MAYKTIHTIAGLAAMTKAEASGVPINLTHMAVGDGNGNAVTPDETQSVLVREMYRHTVNRVYQDPVIQNKFTAELVIPATEGGFVLREVGIFDADGTLFAVGNLPSCYKPMASEGAYGDTVIRMEFMTANADVITLQIDPNVAVATQSWIINTLTPASLLPGGTTGQVLTKQSNADGDADWEDPDVANVVVDMIEEQQTLAASQTIVDLTICTTRGMSLYIDGHRLRGEQWTPDPLIDTRLTLAESYAAGTKIVACQNEPTGTAPAPLERSKNLSDVENKAHARANLDIYSKAESDLLAPAGKVDFFARPSAPAGWLKCNGAAISRTSYQRLFEAIGTRFGAGDGFNTFNLPDVRGEFIRGWDDGRGIDTARELGSWQADEIKSHSHSYEWFPGQGNGEVDNNYQAGHVQSTGSTGATGGSETRPRNVALLACIKY